MVSYENLSDLADGRRLLIGDFRAIGRSQVLFNSAGDRNWWMGTFDGGPQAFTWALAGHTSGFGNLWAGHKFWIGQFTSGGSDQVLFYYPGDQNWWLGTFDPALGRFRWASAGNTTGFGNLMAGHRFWTGRLSRSDRTQVLIYYPGDQNWWMGSYGSAAPALAWKRVAITPDLGDARAAITGSFSCSDRTELLVQDPDRSRWWLASVNDDWGGFWWRMAANTSFPRAGSASETLRAKLREAYGRSLPGCVFYVTRNGRPFADGSFGSARLLGAPDGELPMTPTSIVHVGSITKFFCAVAILRLIEEWNRIVARPARQGEPTLDRTAHRFGAAISLDQAAFPLVESFLDTGMIAGYSTFPGQNVRAITLRQLLDHTSGLPRIGADVTASAFEADFRGARWSDIVVEPGDESPTRVDLRKFVTALLKQNATFPNNYNNDAYAVLTAVIENVTGTPYARWLKERLFNDPRFDDLAPKAADPVRSARYYWFDGNSFRGGNHHPDYTDFTLAGGYYVSGAALAEWVEAVMRKDAVGQGPVLERPERLLSDRPGLAAYAIERYRGFEKNGAASPGGGRTNVRAAFLGGYGDERIFAFVEANAGVDANTVLDAGLGAIAEPLTRRPGLLPATTGTAGLWQTVFWDDSGVKSDGQVVAVDIQPVGVGGVTVNRTKLLGPGPLAGGKAITDVLSAEVRGSMRSASAGFYVFRFSSDDGAFLWIGDQLVADNRGDHGMRAVETDAIWLDANAWYPIRARWYNAGGGANLCLEWRVPGSPAFASVPVANFTPDA